MHGRRQRRCLVSVLAGIALMLVVSACGTTTLLHGSASGAPVGRGAGVPAGAIRVIRGWADALRAGHVIAAAGYFRLPSLFFDGSSPPVRLRTRAEVEQVNMALPCGATLLSVHRRNGYLDALFRLGDRAGPGGEGGCGSGAGSTARTDFLIRAGRIVEWLRAPDEPGDNGTPPAPGSPGSPGAPNPAAPAQTV